MEKVAQPALLPLWKKKPSEKSDLNLTRFDITVEFTNNTETFPRDPLLAILCI